MVVVVGVRGWEFWFDLGIGVFLSLVCCGYGIGVLFFLCVFWGIDLGDFGDLGDLEVRKEEIFLGYFRE